MIGPWSVILMQLGHIEVCHSIVARLIIWLLILFIWCPLSLKIISEDSKSQILADKLVIIIRHNNDLEGKKRKKQVRYVNNGLDLLILIKSAHLNIIAWNGCITTMVINSVTFCRWEICPMLSGMQGNLETPLGIGWPSVRLSPNRSSTKSTSP